MSPEYDALLCKRDPALFAERHLATSGTPMAWGLACGDGWFDLINELCRRLQAAVEAGHSPQPVATQIQEKFGTLRFYLSGSDPVKTRLVKEAECRSAMTCKVCVLPGVLRRRVGVQTLYDVHGAAAPVVDPERGV